MVVVVPAYEPDGRLVDLVRAIRSTAPQQPIVVVDDGSGPAYASVFRAAQVWGCDVIGHVPNRGKGHALKRGFEHVAARYPGADVVCADCDGQHALVDILRVAAAVREHPGAMVLGARQFVGDVPPKSRFGNTLTRSVFQLATGLRLQDTQTGLRGYPSSMLAWLGTVPGDRFEYELNALLDAKRAGIVFCEIPIETIYLEGNESSHFRAVRDSVRVYLPFLRFGASSLASFALDLVLVLVLARATGSLLASVVLARLTSAACNFGVNRVVVFRGGGGAPRAAAGRYATLAVGVLAANYVLLRTLTAVVGVPLLAAKVATEALLFLASYHVQRRYVFARRPAAAAEPAPVSDRADRPVAR
jgi:putative flippase GtrA